MYITSPLPASYSRNAVQKSIETAVPVQAKDTDGTTVKVVNGKLVAPSLIDARQTDPGPVPVGYMWLRTDL